MFDLVHRIGRDNVVYSMSAENSSAIVVNSGNTVIVETEDCFSHAIVSEKQTVGRNFDFSHINPATGPIGVQGAKPGDTLVVSVEKIEVDDTGVMETCPGWGPAGNLVTECVTEIVKIESGCAVFMNKNLKISPMIGVIGNSPESGSISCGTPGIHGGNLDTVDIREGSKIYLPVFVEGGNLSLGDVHAKMGDGEVCGTGIEIRAVVTIRIEIEKRTIEGPIVECDNAFYVIHSEKNFEEASRGAVERAVRLIAESNSIPLSRAYMLASISCDLLVSQVVNPLVTVRMRIPKEIL